VQSFKKFVTEGVIFRNEQLIKPDQLYFYYYLPRIHAELKKTHMYWKSAPQLVVDNLSRVTATGAIFKHGIKNKPQYQGMVQNDVIFRVPREDFPQCLLVTIQNSRHGTLEQIYFLAEADLLNESPSLNDYANIYFKLNDSKLWTSSSGYDNVERSIDNAIHYIKENKEARDALRNDHGLTLDI